jgi:DNA-directed RNA polymerase specialized sigma24 family protein
MHQPLTLNEMYTRYADGQLDRKKFESFIFENVVKNFSRLSLRHWQQDDSADFSSWIYPRIRTAIDSYCDTGSSFETYLSAVIRWAAREYRFKVTNSRITEYTAWTVRVPELYAHEPEIEYCVDDKMESSKSRAAVPFRDSETGKRKNPRQLLILILKCYCYLSDDFLDRIAPRVGIDKDELKTLVDKLRQNRLKRDDKLHVMRESLYCQYYRCIIYEKRLSRMPENSCVALRMRLRLEKARRRLAMMRKRIEKLRPGATNRQVADVLGLSKGTVDSALHSLKNWWKNNPEGVILN